MSYNLTTNNLRTHFAKISSSKCFVGEFSKNKHIFLPPAPAFPITVPNGLRIMISVLYYQYNVDFFFYFDEVIMANCRKDSSIWVSPKDIAILFRSTIYVRPSFDVFGHTNISTMRETFRIGKLGNWVFYT